MRQRVEYKEGDIIGTCIFIKEVEPIIFEVTQTNKTKSVKRCALVKCKCDKEFEVVIQALKNGNTKSCGCIGKEWVQELGKKNITHGQRNHPLYKVWAQMIRRCNNPKDKYYYNYGGRGISVCVRWLRIENFIEDMYSSYVKKLDIDRINTNGNYEPNNCRWVTRKQNCNNTRSNRIIEYQGRCKTVSEWSDELNIPYKRLLARLNNWTVEKSFTYK